VKFLFCPWAANVTRLHSKTCETWSVHLIDSWVSGKWRSGCISLANINTANTCPAYLCWNNVLSVTVMLSWQCFMHDAGEFFSLKMIQITTSLLLMSWDLPMVSIQLNRNFWMRCTALDTFFSDWRLPIPSRSRFNIGIIWAYTSIGFWWHCSVCIFPRCLVPASPNGDWMRVLYYLNILLTNLFHLDTLLINNSTVLILITKILPGICFTSITCSSLIFWWIQAKVLVLWHYHNWKVVVHWVMQLAISTKCKICVEFLIWSLNFN
jgi:hypothetical protein